MAQYTLNHLKFSGSNDIWEVTDLAARGSLAAAYSASSTYAVGDMVLKDGQLYECNTAITSAEAWNAAHWTAVTVGAEIATVKEGLNEYEQIFTADLDESVSNWLDLHPEATTTVDFRTVRKVFETVDDMASDLTITAGISCATIGYYTINDNGGAVYIISETNDRACSIELENGLFAVLVGDTFNTRQIGLKANENGQAVINAFIADTSYKCLEVIDPIVVKKVSSTTSDVNIIELIQIRRDNFTIAFSHEGSFVLETLGEDYYRIIGVRNAENITIKNPVIVGDADTIGITTGEYGHGLYIHGGKNIVVYNGNIGKCFGDAVDITSGSENISFIGTLYCYDCGRQGMSVNNVNGLYIDTIVGSNIRRTPPSAVLDFEPNFDTESIIAEVGTIRGIDCRIGLTVAGRGNKSISVDNIITEHSDSNYNCDLEVYGAYAFNVNPVVDISINRINVSNLKKNCIRMLHLNSNVSLKIGSVIINGAKKQTANSIDEATVFIDQDNNTEVRNIFIDAINVINNTSAVNTYGIFLYSSPSKTCKFVNCKINYYDDGSLYVASLLNYATLENAKITTQVQPNGRYNLNSDSETLELTKETYIALSGKANNVFIVNYRTPYFYLYKSFLDGYTINSESYIVDYSSSSWQFAGVGLFTMVFDHTNKTITVKKIG